MILAGQYAHPISESTMNGAADDALILKGKFGAKENLKCFKASSLWLLIYNLPI